LDKAAGFCWRGYGIEATKSHFAAWSIRQEYPSDWIVTFF